MSRWCEVQAHDPQDAEAAKALNAILGNFSERWKGEAEKQLRNILIHGSPFDRSVFYCTENGVVQSDGGPPRLVSGGPWIPKGALKPGDIVRVQNEPQTIQFSQPLHPRSWTSLHYQKENPMMKPGPYKSTTHGNIPLSSEGRKLLAAERDAVQGAIRAGDFNADSQALSRARGDIARYISDLENFPVNASREKQCQYAAEMSKKREADRAQGLRARDFSALGALAYGCGVSHIVDHYFNNPSTNKGTPMKYPESIGSNSCDAGQKINGAAQSNAAAWYAPAVQEADAPKTRSELIGKATHELVQAQRELEYILQDGDSNPFFLHIGARVDGGDVGSFMRGAVAELVKEQWPALAKKAVARAKARVAKAEKAVGILLT